MTTRPRTPRLRPAAGLRVAAAALAFSTLMSAGVAHATEMAETTEVTTPSITITSPSGGQSFSRAIFDTITVQGVAAFPPPAAATRKFFLRRAGCGTATDNPHLSVVGGTDGGDGCGQVADPAAGAATSYPAINGLGFLLDTAGKAKATIVSSSFQGLEGSPGFGAGNVTLTTTLSGRVGNATKTIGTGTVTYLVTPGTPTYSNTVEMTLSPALADAVVSSLTLAIDYSGAGALHGYTALNDSSFVELPIFDPGVVEVSDSATFSAARTVAAQFQPDGTWVAEIDTPSAGNRTINARAVQVGTKVTASPVAITVTS